MAAVFFDLVGTLVDDESDIAAHELLMAAMRKRFALEDSAAELLGEYHLLGSDQLEEERRSGARRGPSFTRAYTATFVAMLEKRGFRAKPEDEAWFHEAYFDCHRRRVKLMPEARATLARTRKLGVHVGLISDIDRPMLADHLDFLKLAQAFDSVTCSEDARALKPDGRVFAFALRQASCPAREALMVGDSLERDVDGALATGMQAILIDRHNARVTDAPRLRNLKRVPALARKMLEL
ncbi:MAG TPA: HAD family hydrolase [Candidatus Thermoplasmatota archaeon]|nr:HAD family hydrolase [Candidatus Thermoplasmatota archaeon]